MGNSKKRDESIDCAKGIAIIFIVIQHAVTNQSDLTNISQLYILRFITQFTMPAFFLINGYLYNEKYSQKPIWGIYSKFKAYYIPFLKYNIAYLLLHNLFAYLHLVDEVHGNAAYDLKAFIKHFILAITGHREYFSGALWFLGSILTISAIFIISDYFALKLKNGRWVLLSIVAIVVMLAGMSGYVPSAMKLSTSCLYYLVFYVGVLFKKFNILEKIDSIRIGFVTVIFIFQIVICLNSNIGITRTINFQWLYYLTGIMGAMMILQFCRISIIKNFKLLNYIGKSSMEIMALHFLAFKVVSFVAVKYYGFPVDRMADYPVLLGVDGAWWILYAIVGVSLPTIYKFFIDKVKTKGSLLWAK